MTVEIKEPFWLKGELLKGELLTAFVQAGTGTRHSGDRLTRLPGAVTLAGGVLLRPRVVS